MTLGPTFGIPAPPPPLPSPTPTPPRPVPARPAPVGGGITSVVPARTTSAARSLLSFSSTPEVAPERSGSDDESPRRHRFDDDGYALPGRAVPSRHARTPPGGA